MALYQLKPDAICPLPTTTFGSEGIMERGDLQRLLRSNISVIAPDVLVIAEEFSQWEDSKRRIDLLGIDKRANLVVIELKRGEEGAHMELQALRYAAMVSSMTFERAADVFQEMLDEEAPGREAESTLLDFLGWDEPREDNFARDVRIVLVSADFSKELTTSVLWLSERDLDIRCVRMRPYSHNKELLVEVEQVLPLPEAAEFQVRLREKAISQREAARLGGEDAGYWIMNVGDGDEYGARHRSWEDCRKYGFMVAGSGPKYIDYIRRLKPGHLLFAYANGSGYVGLGRVSAEAVPMREFVPVGQKSRLIDLPLTTPPSELTLTQPEHGDWCVAVEWLHSRERSRGVLKDRSRRGTLGRIRQPNLVDELLKEFGVSRETASADSSP